MKIPVCFKAVLTVCVLVLGPVLSHAAATCATDRGLQTDGRIFAVFVVNTVDQQLFFYASAGHSYSVEVINPDTDSGNSVGVFVGASGAGCPSANVSGFTDTSAIDPYNASSVALRGSFVSADTNFHEIRISNSSGSGATVYVSISDTTMYSPRWAKFTGYFTAWGFQNTTKAAITGTLTLSDSTGTQVATETFSIPAGGAAFRDTQNSTNFSGVSGGGTAKFTYLGPPGSILADAYIDSTTGLFIQPVKFETVRSNSH